MDVAGNNGTPGKGERHHTLKLAQGSCPLQVAGAGGVGWGGSPRLLQEPCPPVSAQPSPGQPCPVLFGGVALRGQRLGLSRLASKPQEEAPPPYARLLFSSNSGERGLWGARATGFICEKWRGTLG